MFRLIASTGCALHSAFTLVFIWNFHSERHLCRTVSSVGNSRKNHLERCCSISSGRQVLIATEVREIMSSLMRPGPEYWHHHTDTDTDASSKNEMF